MSDKLWESALQFFGNMTASISHELKNVLAIINETAGLLEDFALMADNGKPLELERLKILSGKIISHVKRGDRIVINMNRFAHSVNGFEKLVDLGELLDLVVSLSKRLAAMRDVTLELQPSASTINIKTNQFFLENLIWRCLDFAMDAAGAGKTVVLSTEKSDNVALIRFARLEGLMGASATDMFSEKIEKGLLGALKGKLITDLVAGEIVLTLPADIGR